MNKENVLKVADAIETGALVKRGIGFNMALIADYSDELFQDQIDNCGTICCIAGTAFAIRYPRTTAKSIVTTGADITRRAAEYLGLNDRAASDLFYPRHLILTKVKPSEAVTVLRHLAKTGEVDWSVALPVHPVTEG